MGIRDNGTAIPPSLWANYRHPAIDPVQPQGFTDTYATDAFVNEGRWMAMCPFGCGSAQVISEVDKKFYCCGQRGCQNFEAGYKLIPVNWPDIETQTVIEDLLLKRPIAFRNWVPSETLAQLQVENEVHGVTN